MDQGDRLWDLAKYISTNETWKKAAEDYPDIKNLAKELYDIRAELSSVKDMVRWDSFDPIEN